MIINFDIAGRLPNSNAGRFESRRIGPVLPCVEWCVTQWKLCNSPWPYRPAWARWGRRDFESGRRTPLQMVRTSIKRTLGEAGIESLDGDNGLRLGKRARQNVNGSWGTAKRSGQWPAKRGQPQGPAWVAG
jgi:hypothetical protein